MTMSAHSAIIMQRQQQATYPGCRKCEQHVEAVRCAQQRLLSFETFLRQQLNFRPLDQPARYLLPDPRHVHRVITGFNMDGYQSDHGDAKPVMQQHGAWNSEDLRLLQLDGSSAHSSSCFADNFFNYRPEEAALYRPATTGPVNMPPSPINMHGDNKYSFTGGSFPTIGTLSSDTGVTSGAMDSTAIERVHTRVDTSQYDHVRPEDWYQSSIEGLGSPSTIDTPGAYTPGPNELPHHHGLPALGTSFGSNDSEMFTSDHAYLFGAGPTHGSKAEPRHVPDQYGALNGLGITGLPAGPHNSSASFRGAYGNRPDSMLAVVPPDDVFRQPSIASASSYRSGLTSSHGSFSSDNGVLSQSEEDPMPETSRRSQRDQQLLKLRLEEHKTYREIKRILKCPEAESTLRGRVRVLTKPKESRVRKPEWESGDVRDISMVHSKLQCTY